MNSLLEIIKLIQRKVICPVCKEHFGTGEVKVKFLSHKEVVVSSVCPNGHVTIFTAKPEQINANVSLTSKEIKDLSEKLKEFDGDFEKIWK